MEFQRQELGTRRKRQRRYLRPIVGIAVIMVVLLGWYRFSLGAVDAGGYEVEMRVPLRVPPGASLSSVAADLADSDLIRSQFAFKVHARLTGKDRLVRAGSYVLQPTMDVDAILDVLTGGAAGEVSVTIPEGFTVADIDARLAGRFTATGTIIACAKTCDFSSYPFLPASSSGPGGKVEGYLFPDTYFIGDDSGDAEAVLRRMLSTFDDKVATGLAADIAASRKSLHDIITMASLIEKEAAGDDERATIAGILWKRLDAGMILGVDASVRYAVNKEPREPLTKADLESDSPYNLRIQKGLPPGPIANPGLASIKAALHPETTPYFYYLHGTDGAIHYAVTNEEHNQNRAKYLQ